MRSSPPPPERLVGASSIGVAQIASFVLEVATRAEIYFSRRDRQVKFSLQAALTLTARLGALCAACGSARRSPVSETAVLTERMITGEDRGIHPPLKKHSMRRSREHPQTFASRTQILIQLYNTGCPPKESLRVSGAEAVRGRNGGRRKEWSPAFRG